MCKSREGGWDCGDEEVIGSSFNTPQDCASGCRQRYSEERHFEFGFIGGPREKECFCEKGDKCTVFASSVGVDAYTIHDVTYQKTFTESDWTIFAANGVSTNKFVMIIS